MPATATLVPHTVIFSKDPAWFEIETSLISGGEPTVANLSLYVKLLEGTDFIVERNIAYSRHNAKAEFDISGIADVGPVPPSDASIDTFVSGVAEGVVKALTIKFEDMHGEPPVVPTAFTTISPFYMVHGASEYWYGFGPGLPQDVLLHSYLDRTGLQVVKELRKGQPEYLYLFSGTGGAVTTSYEVVYTDGTNATAAGSAMTVEEGKVSWINVGWDAVNMDAVVDPDKVVNLYIVKLTTGSGVKQVVYHLDDHDTEHDEYILYDNGIGGCEVLRCSGQHELNFGARKDTFVRARSRGTNYRTGLTGNVNAVGAEEMTLNSGYYSKEYCRHLRQLILADAWYIDMYRKKFYKINILDTRMKLWNKADDLHYVQFTFSYDYRHSSTTFNI